MDLENFRSYYCVRYAMNNCIPLSPLHQERAIEDNTQHKGKKWLQNQAACSVSHKMNTT